MRIIESSKDRPFSYIKIWLDVFSVFLGWFEVKDCARPYNTHTILASLALEIISHFFVELVILNFFSICHFFCFVFRIFYLIQTIKKFEDPHLLLRRTLTLRPSKKRKKTNKHNIHKNKENLIVPSHIEECFTFRTSQNLNHSSRGKVG